MINIKEKTIIEAADKWLTDNCLDLTISQDTDIGPRLNDAWNDWYNDEVLLPVRQAVDEAVNEAITNGCGIVTMNVEDVYDICNNVLVKDHLLIQLMKHSYVTGHNDAVNGYHN